MRLLLDPTYQTPTSREASPRLVRRADSSVNASSPSVLDGQQDSPVSSLGVSPYSTPDLSGAKKDVDDVRNELLRARVAARKVELRRSGRVETKRVVAERQTDLDASRRPVGRQEPVLRQVNNRQPLKRSDSLTKREKTELNQRTKQVEKENKVLRLKAQFEQGAGGSSRPSSRPLAAVHSSGSSGNFDINKVRKKLSDSRNRRIKRRHTVGGTKDFTETILSKLNSGEEERVSSKSSCTGERALEQQRGLFVKLLVSCTSVVNSWSWLNFILAVAPGFDMPGSAANLPLAVLWLPPRGFVARAPGSRRCVVDVVRSWPQLLLNLGAPCLQRAICDARVRCKVQRAH